jgi:(S)-3,5-dihydroxyphenylglycine transaminase
MRHVQLKDCFDDPLLDVMNFLNEVVLEFPEAISFAPGRPLESLFAVEEHLAAIGRYAQAMASRGVRDAHQVWQDLGQYSRTNGSIGELIAAQLRLDEGITVDPEAVMVTVGAQEAMAVLLAGLFDASRDVLLVSDPTYIGITGLARILGIRVVPVPSGEAGLDPDAVERAIVMASREGRVRALYDIPSFNNPLGTSLGLADRRRLIEVCRRHGVLIFEDHAYGLFAYDGERLPTLKALDDSGTVIHIGSFAKTLFPGLRVGYLVADQATSSGGPLARALSRVKSLITVNTPPPMQAAVAAVLLQTGGSLEPIVAPKRARYRLHRDAMIAALARTFADVRERVSWNRPAGGFFLTMTLPFAFGRRELQACAAHHGAIVCPMQFFSLTGSREQQIRLSFSYVGPEAIAEGIDRLGGFVRATLSDPSSHSSKERSIMQQTRVPSMINGIEHVEIYVSNCQQAAHYYRTALGFTVLGPVRRAEGFTDRTTLAVQQGRIRLLLTAPLTPDSDVAQHLHLHGEGIKDIALSVTDVRAVFDRAVAHGARPLQRPSARPIAQLLINTAQVESCNGTLVHTLIERPAGAGRQNGDLASDEATPMNAGLLAIDHIAMAVARGDLDRHIAFYRDAFGFEETHQEDVRTDYSAMRSKVVQAANGRVRFPIMEPAPGLRRSQIETYIAAHGGAGVQHLAFESVDIVKSVSLLAGVIDFLPTPATYYDALESRVGDLSDELQALRRYGILADRDATGLLLQVFTKPIGPRPTLFLEVIERRGAKGFGGGNIRALFEAVERAETAAATV